MKNNQIKLDIGNGCPYKITLDSYIHATLTLNDSSNNKLLHCVSVVALPVHSTSDMDFRTILSFNALFLLFDAVRRTKTRHYTSLKLRSTWCAMEE